ncbi:hypothetical protein HY622_00265 [Candidatus Uhrbacteria bacterium]|nr:hypothetical protein [Candidatus Uhrbacteria bacterium]
MQLTQLLAVRDIHVEQRSEDIIAEQRFLGNLARFVREDGSVLLHINSSDGYWNALLNVEILLVAQDSMLRIGDGKILYGGSGFVRMYPGDALQWWRGVAGPAYVIYLDETQGLLLMDFDAFQSGQRPSQAV